MRCLVKYFFYVVMHFACLNLADTTITKPWRELLDSEIVSFVLSVDMAESVI